MSPRDAAARKTDALARLTTPAIDAWVATASRDGVAHLVPLSLAWVGERAVIAVAETSVTARNLPGGARARLAVGPTRDVVMIDAVVEKVVGIADDAPLAAAYAAQADWDPRASNGYVFVVLRPDRLQTWRDVDEIPDRTLMRNGAWSA